MYPFIINFQKKPRRSITDLLEKLSIFHSSHLDEVIASTQNRWIRKKERWKVEEIYLKQRDDILDCMKEIGCMKPIFPQFAFYDTILLLGAPYKKFLQRLDFLNYLLESGLHTKKIYLLTGQRPLDVALEVEPSQKDDFPKTNDLKNESSLIDFLIKKKASTGVKRLLTDHISLSMLSSPHEIRRPNTADTLIEFSKCFIDRGSCLLISNQPYVGYQQAVGKTILSDFFHVETVGSFSYTPIKSAVYLDNLARWLYQERIYLNLQKYQSKIL